MTPESDAICIAMCGLSQDGCRAGNLDVVMTIAATQPEQQRVLVDRRRRRSWPDMSAQSIRPGCAMLFSANGLSRFLWIMKRAHR
jgi:hypothetical protein